MALEKPGKLRDFFSYFVATLVMRCVQCCLVAKLSQEFSLRIWSLMFLQPHFAADPFGRAPPSSSYPPPLMDDRKHRPPPLMERSVVFSVIAVTYDVLLVLSGPILAVSPIWTKVRQIKFACALVSVFCNAVFQLTIHCCIPAIFTIKSEIAPKFHVFRPPNFWGRVPPNVWPNFVNLGHHLTCSDLRD